jgi:hypothetical protein
VLQTEASVKAFGDPAWYPSCGFLMKMRMRSTIIGIFNITKGISLDIALAHISLAESRV